MCIVRLRHRGKTVKCRIFVVTGDGPVLLWMPDIELLDILKIICAVIGDPIKNRMFDFQTMQTSNDPSCKANKAQ